MPYRFLACLAVFVSGCSGLSAGDDIGSDGGGIFNPDGSIRNPDDANMTNTNMAYVRLAQLSPVLGAVDFCLRPKGTTYFDGPKLGANTPAVDASTDAGAKKGVAFPGASGYTQVLAAGATDIAIVAAADTSCSSPKLVGTVTIDPNKRMTIAIMGSSKDADAGTNALAIASFTDDTQAHADSARLRVIHAALGGPNNGSGYGSLAASIGFANQVDPIAAKIDPRMAATPSSTVPIVDSLGYGSHAPITGQSSLRLSSLAQMGGPWSTLPADLGLAANAVKTAFLVSDTQSFGVVLCGDLPSGGDMPCQVFTAK